MKNNKSLLLVLIGILLISCISIISAAENKTCSGESCKLNTNITKEITTTANCSEQLEDLLNIYNNLTEDYQSGANCGTVRYLLIDNNLKLSNRLKDCNKEVGENNVYKVGFYFLLILSIAVAIYWIYLGYKVKE